MKQSIKSAIGVTLLEIMLVLAIASMIVVMSIRYYQSASNSQQANTALQQVQAVIAAMDNLGIAGGYSTITASQLSAVVGSSNMITPNKGVITLGTVTTSTYTVTFGLTTQTCPNVAAKLKANPKSAASACAAGTLTLSYDATK
jgi:type II secretory pathway pseudopilin PulG